ncbi:MAG: glycosyltransferase family 2 protein [Desulfovibrionaceae bacterium]|nr:glycosyltransferase family 2 protein [Desulfovibrionaceae bacterium]MBF0515258.1 glycosyltransferase family 2 protein [Desulfovibrionaceae bacterium]
MNSAPSPAQKNGLLSVVLSFYNEEAVLPELLRRLRQTLASEREKKNITGYELIFVNDASKDGSLELLRRECLAWGDIVIVDMSRNFGVSECVMAGLTQAKGDAVVYMDADLQDPPELIVELIEKWRTDPDVEVVYTTRNRRFGENPFKLLLTKYGYRLLNSISEIELPLDSGDFKLLSRRVVNELVKLKEKKPYMRGLVNWVGFKSAQVFYDRDPRFDGADNTKCPVWSRKVISGYLDRALISFSDAPLKLSLVLGFSVSAVALIYILVVVFQKIMGWYVPGWPALMAATLFLGGVMLMVMGFLGLYINIIFLETKGRPNYIIKDIITSKSMEDLTEDKENSKIN